MQWPDEQTVKLARREWAKDLDELTWDELEKALNRAKAKLMAGDDDFYWPDVGRIVGLARDNRTAAYHAFPPASPQSDAQVSARRRAGRKAMAGVWAALGGSHAE